MVGPSLEYCLPADQEIFDKWMPKSWWDSSQEDATYLVSCIIDHPSHSIIVLDDYRVDEPYQQVLLNAGLRWLQFDGKADKPLWADWVVSANPALHQNNYVRLLQKPNA